MKALQTIRKFRKLISIITIVTTVVGFYVAIMNTQVNADVIDLKDIGITFGLSDGSTAPSGSIQALLQSCEKIAIYMRDHNYRYYTHHPDSKYHGGDYFNNVYNIGPYDVSCCATYVAWCLQDAGFITNDMHTEEVCWSFGPNRTPLSGIWKIMIDSPDWKNVEDILGRKPTEADLKPGDIQIYKNGGSHTNIYAGNGQYWDAGRDEAGAFEGVTMTHHMNTYTCSYRHKSMW